MQEHVGAMIKSMTFLAHSSALYHGSVTRTGRTADHAMNYLLAFVAHQAAVGAFGERPRSHILHDVSLGRRYEKTYTFAWRVIIKHVVIARYFRQVFPTFPNMNFLN